MAIHGAFTNCQIYVDGYDLKSETNMVRLEAIKEVKDRSVFGNTYRNRAMAGLADVNFQAAGFHSTAQDTEFRANWAQNDTCTSVYVPATGGATVAVGDLAWFFKGVAPKYTVGGAHGEDLMWTLEAQGGAGAYGPLKGWVLEPGLVAKTADANGTGYQCGAIVSGQYLYAMLHVTSVSASDSIVVTIESDDNADFTSATTRITFDSLSAVGAAMATRVAGPITDDYWRAVFNVTGADVSIVCACAMAIM